MGLLWPCPQILRPNWKGFPRANPLAYRDSSLVMKEKSFLTLAPGVNVIKQFTVVSFAVVMFVIKRSVCPWYTFPASTNVCG